MTTNEPDQPADNPHQPRHHEMHGPWGYTHPADRGQAYIATMRDIAEAHDDITLHEHHLEELVRIIRPFPRMTPDELNNVLDGIHDALLELLGELIVQPRIGNRPFRDVLGVFGDPE